MTFNTVNGAKHERHLKLSADQREANIKRWPVRHGAETNALRALYALYPELVTQQQEVTRALGEVVDYGQPTVPAAEPAGTDLNLSEIRGNVATFYDQEAA